MFTAGRENQHELMNCGTAVGTLSGTRKNSRLSCHPFGAGGDGHIPNAPKKPPGAGRKSLSRPGIATHAFNDRDQFVSRIYYLCSGVAHLSGFRCNLSGLQYAAQRVCHDISRTLFIENQAEVKTAFDNHVGWNSAQEDVDL